MSVCIHTPWFLLVNVVVERLIEDGQHEPSDQVKAAELLLELHGHDARGLLAYTEHVNTAVQWILERAYGGPSKPGHCP